MAKRSAKSADNETPVSSLSVADKIKLVLKQTSQDNMIVGLASDPEMKKWLDYGKCPTEFPALNTIFDGGFPKGKFSIVAGPEQSCKSTLCLNVVATSQKNNPNVIWAWVDAENSFDPRWAVHSGVDLSRLIILKPAIMEDLMQLVIDAVKTGALEGIIVDSVGALTPLAEIKKKKDDKDMTRTLTDDSVAALAKKIGQFFRMANEFVFRTNTCCILIGHVYTPIGNDYLEYEVKGGNALKHWGHLRVLSRRRKGKEDEKIERVMPSGHKKDMYVAYEAVFTVDKTRQGGHQGYEVAIPFVFGKGLSNTKSVIDMAFVHGIISGDGWYSHHLLPGGKIQGRSAVEEFFTTNAEAFGTLLAEVGRKLAEKEEIVELNKEELKNASSQGEASL